MIWMEVERLCILLSLKKSFIFKIDNFSVLHQFGYIFLPIRRLLQDFLLLFVVFGSFLIFRFHSLFYLPFNLFILLTFDFIFFKFKQSCCQFFNSFAKLCRFYSPFVLTGKLTQFNLKFLNFIFFFL
jgi:hypothetical protein